MKKFILCITLLCINMTQVRAERTPTSMQLQSFPTSIQKDSLLFRSWSIYSQFGEEGILDEMLKRLHITKGFFVEFGAADGSYLSNTRFLADRGWKGAFIEASSSLIANARENCQHLKNVQCIHEFVTSSPKDTKGKTFDQIADTFFPREEIDVLSIDIDGSDYLILETLKRKPKIIIIEGGVYWFPTLTVRVPDEIASVDLNQPLPVMFDIAKKQGYRPVCFTINTFLVREDLFCHFKEIKNDPVSLWFDSWFYYSTHNPGHISWVTNARQTSPLIRLFDQIPTP